MCWMADVRRHVTVRLQLEYRYRFFFSSRRRHTRDIGDWSSDVCSSDLILAEDALHYFLFSVAQQSVVHENAGELVADRFMQQRRYHGRIDTAAQPEHDFCIAHLSPHPFARFLDERAHRPIHCAMADVIDKVLQNLLAARGVRDFRMKLQAVKFSLWILDRGEV